MNNLFFDFTVDKTAKKVFITRDFNAPLSLVWKAFTNAELLDQWVAPAPFTAKTKEMNFEEGGKRFYAMISPEGVERWALQQYIKINPTTSFSMFNVFTDAEANPEPTGSYWDYTFKEQNNGTQVQIEIYNESFERMESLLEGFKIGFTMTLTKLDDVLNSFSNT